MKKLLRVMKALSDPSRVRALKLLEERKLCVCELQVLLGLAQSTVSKHMKTLEDAGLVESERQGTWIIYRLAKGDESDLMEILGNVLDNACKAAKYNVSIRVVSEHKKLVIEIADDGEGIDESQQAIILSRGGRADTYQAGHGIGLAIVNDLVSSYQGKLFISKSATLSGAVFTLIFE